jgi:hypothetical protein
MNLEAVMSKVTESTVEFVDPEYQEESEAVKPSFYSPVQFSGSIIVDWLSAR